MVIVGELEDKTEKTDNDSATAVVRWTEPTAHMEKNTSDRVILDSNYKPNDSFPIGVTEVCYTAEDAVLDTATAMFYVTVTGRFRRLCYSNRKLLTLISSQFPCYAYFS